ncbi:uncharacterized protein [Heterodontus francisci]|uniref:uncharacterized protein n=1 Tax=Heterodontus francisci TaxID=7792 RepID=UPI00355BE295
MSHGYQMRLKLHRRLSSDALQLLDEMGAGFPVHCRSQGLKIKTLNLMRIATNSKCALKSEACPHALAAAEPPAILHAEIYLNGGGGASAPSAVEWATAQSLAAASGITTQVAARFLKRFKPLETEDKIMIIYQILLHISKIYRTNVCSKPWDKNGMEVFETHLHQQLEELSQDLQRWSDSKMTGKKRIHKYFTKLRIFLENKEYSRCAWEMIHYESRKNLQQAINLLA